MEAAVPPARYLSKTRWCEYRRALYPKLKLSRTKEDECNVCERIRVQLKNEDLDDDSRKILQLELKEHLEPARAQRKI